MLNDLIEKCFEEFNDCDADKHRITQSYDQNLKIRTSKLGSLAQLVEHQAFNLLVLGSNPRRPTNLQEVRTG